MRCRHPQVGAFVVERVHDDVPGGAGRLLGDRSVAGELHADDLPAAVARREAPCHVAGARWARPGVRTAAGLLSRFTPTVLATS